MTTAITVSDYMHKPEAIQRFAEVLGNDKAAQSYIQSVLILVANDDALKECTPRSIFTSAVRAASLGLSCDKSLKQAWLVPYNKKVRAHKQGDQIIPEHWEKEAQFQPHYLGLYNLAMRTGKYWMINVAPIYDGQQVLENPLTGLHAVREGGVIGKPDSTNPAYVDVTVRRKKDKKVIGWLGYFKTKKGFEKSVWMSSIEIDDHARKYVKDYDKNPNWNDVDKRPTMEMKTVLRQLLAWADLSGTENAQLMEALKADEEPIDAQVEDMPEPSQQPPAAMDYEIAKTIMVKVGKDGKVIDKFIGELDAENLNKVILSDNTSDEQKEAARIVLSQDFNMEPPESPKRTEQTNMRELGFE